MSKTPLYNGLMREALWYVADWLESFGAEFWLDCGVLLGAIFMGDFIGVDYDIDLGLKKGWYGVVRERARNRQKLAPCLTFVWAGNDALIQLRYDSPNGGHSVMIDLCFFNRVRWMDHYEWQCRNAPDYLFWHPDEHLSKLERFTFLGREFYVPYKPRRCLLHHYGPNIEIPPKHPYVWRDGYNGRKLINGKWIDNLDLVYGYALED